MNEFKNRMLLFLANNNVTISNLTVIAGLVLANVITLPQAAFWLAVGLAVYGIMYLITRNR